MIKIRDLCYSVEGENGRQQILRNLNLDIDDGKLIAITGPNGGGKTTLAKAIMGLVRADSGSIELNGEEISGLSVTERAKRGISYGFQQPPRFKGLRVRDLMNIAAGKSLDQEECCGYLARVGLCSNDYLDREVNASLSGGEVKRIEIATILARQSDFMIYDEPEAGIDLWSFSRLTDTFKRIHEERGATLMIISHQERILKLADEIALVAEGQIQLLGPTEEIFPRILANTVGGCCYINQEDCHEFK